VPPSQSSGHKSADILTSGRYNSLCMRQRTWVAAAMRCCRLLTCAPSLPGFTGYPHAPCQWPETPYSGRPATCSTHSSDDQGSPVASIHVYELWLSSPMFAGSQPNCGSAYNHVPAPNILTTLLHHETKSGNSFNPTPRNDYIT
jgi:hypothetical protein